MLIAKNPNLTLFGALLPITVFTKELGMLSLGGIQFDMLSYPFFMLTFTVFLLSNRITFRISEVLIFGYIVVIGLINIVGYDLQIKPFLKQFFPIIIIYFSIKTILLNNNIKDIFNRYLELALIVAFIGILQILLKLVGINFLTPLAGFYIDSVALEPSHYVLIILPAVVYYIEYKNYNWKFLVLFSTIILTFKVTALVSIVVYIILRNFKKIKKQFLLGSIAVGIFLFIVNQVPEFADRFYSVLGFFEDSKISNVQNLTTFSFVSNLQVASGNFLRTYGFGIGLGGHEEMYYRHMTKDIFLSYYYGINAASAHSLTIRIFSELGLIGIFIYLISFYKVMQIKSIEYSAIAWASLSYFIVKSFKLGGYFDYGSLFFLLLILTAIRLDTTQEGGKLSKY